MPFILLVAFSALFVAGCSAFFSIQGLVVLFSGSAIAIGIMATSLEIGKLVAASFLHKHWNDISILLKSYLCIAVAVLMLVTSLGIFGFLTGAYQKHSANVGVFESQLAAAGAEKATLEQSVLEASERIRALTQVRAEQETRVKEAGNYKLPREQAYKAIADANSEISLKEQGISAAREKIIALDQKRAELDIEMNTTTDVGSFKFIASTLGTDIDTAVRYFIFALIFVFDPLAVTLVLALNVLLERRSKLREAEPSEKLEKPVKEPIKQKRAEVVPQPFKQTELPSEELERKAIEEDEKIVAAADLYAAGQITKEEYKRRIKAGKNNSVIIS